MSAESLLFIALFVKGSSTMPKTPKVGGSGGSQPNRGGRLRRAFQQGVKEGFQQGKNKAAGGKQGGAMNAGLGGAASGAAKGAAAGGPMGAVAGGVGGGIKGLAQGLKNKANIAGSAAKEGAKQGAIGAAAGYLGGANRAQQQGKGPRKEIMGGLGGALKGAKNRGAWGLNKGANAARDKQQGPGNIPKKDLRDPSATRELGNMKQKYDALNKKVETATKKIGAQVGEKMTGIPAPLLERAIAVAMVIEKIKRRAMLIILLAGFFLLFMLFDSSTFDAQPANQGGAAGTPTTSDICKPAQVPNGQANGTTVVCTITVTYSGSAQDITILDTIMPGMQYVQATNNGIFDATANTVTWDAKQDGLQLNPVNITVSVVLKITTAKPNTTIYNAYTINPTGLSGGGGTACTATGSPDMEAKWKQVLQLGQQYGPVWIGFLNDARSIAQKEDYPLAVIVGQGALESAHGTSNFAMTRHNFFGFMAYDNNLNATKTYPNAAASIEDYVQLIKGGNGGTNQLYLQAYANRSNPVKMVQLIKAGGYATDPNYVAAVTGIQEFKILEGVSLPCN